MSNSPGGFSVGGWAAHLDENHTPSTGFEEGMAIYNARTERREAIKSPRTGLRLPVPRLIGDCGLGVSRDWLRAMQVSREAV